MQLIRTADHRFAMAISNKALVNSKTVLSAAMAARCAPFEGYDHER
jgi:hypothetical protein